jgi:uncharacterized protein
VVNAILDEALFCHVGFTLEAQPYVVPTVHARVGERLYLHGSAANRMLRSMNAGIAACVTVTLLDGLVLARSAFHHSMNYRSVMIFGGLERVEDDDEKRAALAALVEHVVPGRGADARPPSPAELRTTSVLRLPIDEASAKVRTGGPVDDEEDMAMPIWAGQLPLSTVFGAPIADAGADAAVPEYVTGYRRP